MAVAPTNVSARLGTIIYTLNDEARPGWLKADGVSEYGRDAYAAFVTKFSAKPWFLAGSSGSTFKIIDLSNMVLVAAGGAVSVGQQVGNSSVTLTSANIPEHDHTYDQPGLDAPQNVNVVGSILGGVLTGLTLPKPKVTSGAKTGKAGSASPAPISLLPKGLAAQALIFAGLPK